MMIIKIGVGRAIGGFTVQGGKNEFKVFPSNGFLTRIMWELDLLLLP